MVMEALISRKRKIDHEIARRTSKSLRQSTVHSEQIEPPQKQRRHNRAPYTK